ncbi:transposase [Aeromonas popoffii]|uniref:transposase n=1 Tax=Aeromonas popoffii TaxID=70856 RepID=UPI003BB204B8
MVYTNSRTNSSRKGRANYSREFKQRLVDAANQPGVSVSKLAQEHGVNANLLFKWRRDAKAEAPALYPIELVFPPLIHGAPCASGLGTRSANASHTFCRNAIRKNRDTTGACNGRHRWHCR